MSNNFLFNFWDCGHIAKSTSYFTFELYVVNTIEPQNRFLHRKNNLLLCDESYVLEMNWKCRVEDWNFLALSTLLQLKMFYCFSSSYLWCKTEQNIFHSRNSIKFRCEQFFFILFILKHDSCLHRNDEKNSSVNFHPLHSINWWKIKL